MEFNIQKFLVENKLTRSSYLREDDNTGQILHTNDENDWDQSETDDADATFDSDSADPFGGTYPTKGSNWDDNPGKADYFKTQHGADYDREPGENNLKVDRKTKGLQSLQSKLQGLESQKDALLMQFKSGQMSIDKYKEAIGNIPNQIKKLRADIQQAMTVSTDDDSEEEMA